MKAIVCQEYGPVDQLTYGDLPDPSASEHQVRIRVKACGVNFPDLLIVQGLYQFRPPPPFSPGGEVAGIVEEVGSQVTHVNVGDRVIGLGIWGGYAEQMVLDAKRVLPMPDEMSFEVGSAITTTYGTCLHAFKNRAALKPGETVLILGAAGGIGTASIALAKKMGARVIAASSSDEKLETCRKLGADELINYTTEDLKKRAKALSGGGVDVVVDPVGGDFAEPALRAMAWKGRYLVIGFAAGNIPQIPLNLTLLKGCSVVGVFWGAFVERESKEAITQLQQIGRWVATKEIDPFISKTYPLREAQQALKDVAERRVQGKIVLLPEA